MDALESYLGEIFALVDDAVQRAVVPETMLQDCLDKTGYQSLEDVKTAAIAHCYNDPEAVKNVLEFDTEKKSIDDFQAAFMELAKRHPNTVGSVIMPLTMMTLDEALEAQAKALVFRLPEVVDKVREWALAQQDTTEAE